MTSKLSRWLLVAIAGSAPLAACGSSSDGAPASAGRAAVGQRAVAMCKHSIQIQPEIAAITRTKLELICRRAASGNPAALEQVTREACIGIVSVAPVPVPKEQALAHCNKVS